MRRSFGTEISGNRRPRGELSEVVRAGIIAESEAGISKLEIAEEYRVCQKIVSGLRPGPSVAGPLTPLGSEDQFPDFLSKRRTLC